MKSLPYYKMYPSDADSDENFRLMSYEQRGLYWTLLDHAWMNDGIPAAENELRSLAHLAKRDFDRMWARVSKCFPESDGRRRNPRQEEERIHAMTKSARATEAVRTRYERRENVPIRASDSEYVSGSVFSPEKEKKVNANFEREFQATQPIVGVLDELKGLYEQAGLPLAPKHENMAVQYLLQIEPDKISHVPRYVRHMLESGRWSSAATTRGLLNLLRDGDWDVPILERSIPPPQSKSTSVLAEMLRDERSKNAS